MADPALNYNMNVVHTLRKDFTSADNGKTLIVGVVPAGSLIRKPTSGVNVSVAFNDSGTDLLDIGVSGDNDLYATDLSVAAVGFQACDEAVSFLVGASDVTITAVYAGQNSDMTTGAGQIVIDFSPPDPAL